MRVFSLLQVFFFVLSVSAAMAQESLYPAEPTIPEPLGAVATAPECFNIINTAPYTVFGTVQTNFYVRPDGIKARHQSNFRLTPEERAEICTTGPFYEGRTVELVLRSLVPLFRCKTGLGGDVLIRGRHKDEGGTETWAECLPPQY